VWLLKKPVFTTHLFKQGTPFSVQVVRSGCESSVDIVKDAILDGAEG